VEIRLAASLAWSSGRSETAVSLIGELSMPYPVGGYATFA
jgi:hypothetical protein